MTLRTQGRSDFGKVSKSTVTAKRKAVTVAGTAEQLDSLVVPSGYDLVVKALATNTGKVNVSDSKANAEDDDESFNLSAGESISYKITNANALWVDADNSSEGVTYTVES